MNKSDRQLKYDQYFYSRGKFLLSGEYFILDGAKGLALPTVLGQSMGVSYSQSFSPMLRWKSFDVTGSLWFEALFELWHFNLSESHSGDRALFLQKIMRQARAQNKHFLRDEVDILVETYLDFPLDWGMGSSSTLMANIAQWAGICPFKLLAQTTGGSGYDIACAQADGPITFIKGFTKQEWAAANFDPPFSDNLFFVHLGKKQYTGTSIGYYNKQRPFAPEIVNQISSFTDDILAAKKLEDFEFALFAHEETLGKQLHLTPLKELLFDDFWGEIKSLGAWGGDTVLATSERSYQETCDYFFTKGYPICMPYNKLVLKREDNKDRFRSKKPQPRSSL